MHFLSGITDQTNETFPVQRILLSAAASCWLYIFYIFNISSSLPSSLIVIIITTKTSYPHTLTIISVIISSILSSFFSELLLSADPKPLPGK